jgi:hypothetical protein
MLNALTSTLGKLFGTDKAVTAVINNASNAIGKLVYTSEEKAEDHARAVSEARLMVVEWMRSTSGQNLARRLLAMIITGIWCGQYLAMMFLSVASVWSEKPDKLIESANIVGGYAESMNGAMMLILAFYFAAPHMDGIVKGALQKFGNGKGVQQ